jgi:hypothetical protein
LNSPSLPDGIAFIERVRVFSAFSENDYEKAVLYFSDESGITKEDAKQIVLLSVDALSEIESDVRARNQQLGCAESGGQKVYGDQVYPVFEEMDDIREVVADEHLKILMNSLSPQNRNLFGQWLDIKKLDTQYIKFDFKKAYERSGESADAVLSRICASYEGDTR